MASGVVEGAGYVQVHVHVQVQVQVQVQVLGASEGRR